MGQVVVLWKMENLDRLLLLVLVELVLILQPLVWLKININPKVSKPGITGPYFLTMNNNPSVKASYIFLRVPVIPGRDDGCNRIFIKVPSHIFCWKVPKNFKKVQKYIFSLDSGPRGDSHLINKGPSILLSICSDIFPIISIPKRHRVALVSYVASKSISILKF